MNDRYLGDGVYASFDGWHIWIWVSDGIKKSQHIALDPGVIASLKQFSEDSWKEKNFHLEDEP
jgi:hypothetical protein